MDRPRPNTAQSSSRSGVQLNTDVLYQILPDAGTKAQASAALTCRLWHVPGQKSLYRSITFRSWARQRSEINLVRTLREYPHIRALVRQICIHSSNTPDEPETFQWLKLFPEKSLHNFTYICWPRSGFQVAMFDFPAVRTAPYLTICGPDRIEHLVKTLSSVHMCTLELDFTSCDIEKSIVDIGPGHAPHLTDLRLTVEGLPYQSVNILLKAFSSQLRAFHLHIAPGKSLPRGRRDKHGTVLNPDWLDWACVFAAHACRVPNLIISGFPTSGSPNDSFIYRKQTESSHAIMLDSLFDSGTSLRASAGHAGDIAAMEHLCCAPRLYSRRLLETLAPTVRVLEFYIDSEGFPFEKALLDMLAQRGRQGHSLRRLGIFASDVVNRGLFDVIEGACEKNGVEFRFERVDTPLHSPPTRPAIVWD